MTLTDFKRSLSKDDPPSRCSRAMAALWWCRKGDWERAHQIVMDDNGAAAAWVHAHLHRLEGDYANARYWYRQARQPAATDAIDAEWEAIAAALLAV